LSSQLVLSGGGLQIEFARRQDRWGHTISRVEGDQVTPLLESLEGPPDEPWVAGPPLQDAHRETRPGGIEVALLVGAADGNHWSLSCEFHTKEGRAVFDVACRVRILREGFASVYQALDPDLVEVELIKGGRHSEHQWRMTTEIGGSLVLDTDHPQFASLVKNCRFVIPALSDETELPCTLRWRYELHAQ
jgi:hypothetical protein